MLILEDGSLVVGANSFVSVAEVRAYAIARASDLAAFDDSAIEAAAIKSADYLRSLRHRFKGAELIAEQSLPFPRQYVFVAGFELPSNTVPQGIKDAACQLAIESANGAELQPTTNGQVTTKEKVGPLETTFAPNSAPDGTQLFAAATALLAPYMTGASGGGLSLLRI
jgi:hypothetical protein